MKSALWQLLSGSIHLMYLKGGSYYCDLVQKCSTTEHKDFIIIERDLKRSKIKIEYFQASNPHLQVSLGRVLKACTLHKSYCPNMLTIAMALLMFLEEEEAFYVLAALSTKYPEYFQREPESSTEDTKKFSTLLTTKISNHFKNNRIDVTSIAISWFLCLYIDKIPWEATLRVMDCFIAEGPNILIQMGATILNRQEAELLKLNNTDSVRQFMSMVQFDCGDLLKEYPNNIFFQRPNLLNIPNIPNILKEKLKINF
uniref:Rab-GAP TBC domain-containing protein n=1 Tax=Arcella intermedia TaxID=1963864 RepID=A0A6B2LEC3_9EUKA